MTVWPSRVRGWSLSCDAGFAALFFCLVWPKTVAVSQALIWTEKTLDGFVRIRGLPGNPQSWIDHGIPSYVTYGMPADRLVQYKSVRTALGFRHASRDLVFSDVGYREIFKMQLPDGYIGGSPLGDTVKPVYSGISSRVRGVAVDWQAANVYWTDSSYNWITVAALDKRDVYDHIVTTDLDIPVGIAVYPQKGMLFWTDQGIRPRIERSRLDGSGRFVIHDTDVVSPAGITIDYSEDQVFWIDDSLDMVFRMSIDGENVRGFKVTDKDGSNFQYLYGIVIYQNFIFVTDQFMMNIKIFDKNHEITLGDIQLKLAVPYDVMMYDSSLQEDFYSDCNILRCNHICINLGNKTATCRCSQGYQIQDDGVTCKKVSSFNKPEYIYSLGSRICSSHVKLSSLDQEAHISADVMQCLKAEFGYIEALTADVHANLLFFSDSETSAIRRVRLDNDNVIDDHVLQAGVVRGLSADWINNNVYWTDNNNGQITVSKYDGSLITVIVSRLHRPHSLAADPVSGYLYWSALDAIYRSYLDGTNVEAFVSQGVHSPQGLSINYKDMSLYWVDNLANGISRIHVNGTERTELYKSADKTYRAISVYQNYLAWTDGKGSISFSEVTAEGHVTDIKVIKDDDDHTSNSIITYADINQPITSDGACVRQLCSQLCLARPEGAACRCTAGFRLDADGKDCVSLIKDRDFVIFADPLHRIFYQLDAMSLDRQPPLEGVLLRDSGSPTLIAYHLAEGILYWYDATAAEIKRKVFLRENRAEYVVLKMTGESRVGEMHIDQDSETLYFTDTIHKSLNSVSLLDVAQVKTVLTDNLVPEAFTIDVNSGWMFWLVQRPDSLFTIWRSRTSEMPRKVVVVDQIRETGIRGLTVDSKDHLLYWWNKETIWSVTTAGTDMTTYHTLPTTDIISVAAYAGYLYISDHKQRYLTKYSTLKGTYDVITDALCSRIESVRVFMAKYQHDSLIPLPTVRPRNKGSSPTSVGAPPSSAESLASSTEEGSSLRTTLASGLSTVVVVVVVIVVVIVLVVRRRRLAKRPPSAEFDADAHDNPTYMRADEVPRRSAHATSLPVGGDRNATATSGDGATDRLPEVGARRAAPMTSAGCAAAVRDTATLVRNMADQSEVTIQMGTSPARAAYTTERTQS